MTEPRTSNAAGGHNPFYWDDYDRLPSLIRRVMMYAPVELGTDRAMFNVAAYGPEKALAEEVRVARAAVRRIALEHYGPTHPQAAKAE